MRWLLLLALYQLQAGLFGQEPAPSHQTESQPRQSQPSELAQPPQPVQTAQPPGRDQPSPVPPNPLPDSPGTIQTAPTYHQSVWVTTPPPCKVGEHPTTVTTGAGSTAVPSESCTPPAPDRNPYQRFLNYPAPLSLSAREKGLLAIHNVVDPGNLFTITATAGFNIGIDPHTAYGPGLKGFGKNAGYSLVQDATGEFISTFAIDSLLREDPHYHRSPNASIPRRFLHAVRHTVISQHDDGTPMPNYSVLLGYPISAELSNLYVPGIHGNGESTVARVATGLASDPIDSIITEFLPDFAKRIHVHVIFVQQIINKVASGQPL